MTKLQRIIVPVILLSIACALTMIFYHRNPHFSFTRTSFSTLPNWQNDNHASALLTFKKSCAEISKRNPTLAFGRIPAAGVVADWQVICNNAFTLNNSIDNQTARQFFEKWFEPYAVKVNFSTQGLFTGYYLPLLHASLTKTKEYFIPIYGLPRDLIKFNLFSFNPKNENKWIIAQLKKNNVLQPYPTRSDIDKGLIADSAPVLAWGNSLIDLFFAQIQGSALIELPNKQHLILGYEGTNGQPYTAIGKVLITQNEIKKTEVSMQTIRAWLLQHPERIASILNTNASYVFFKFLKNEDPVGSETVALTPMRSLAVDKMHIPLGAPIWLSTTVPSQSNQPVAFQHLMVAQDTGGAIKGAIRGDVYWGAGNNAAFIAGHMQSGGRYWILLPRK